MGEIVDEVERILDLVCNAGSQFPQGCHFFGMDQLRRAAALALGKARLEASGGITLDRIRAIAETGVDDISVGDITKDLASVDLSMRFLAR